MVSLVDDAARRASHSRTADAAPAEFPTFAPFLALTRIWVRPVDALVVHQSASHADVAGVLRIICR